MGVSALGRGCTCSREFLHGPGGLSPPQDRIKDTSENIIFPQTWFVGGYKVGVCLIFRYGGPLQLYFSL